MIKGLVKTLSVPHMWCRGENRQNGDYTRRSDDSYNLFTLLKRHEGTNNKIKLIKRRGFGYRNDDHLFLRLQLETGH